MEAKTNAEGVAAKKTVAVDLDMKERMMLVRAARHYYDNVQRCDKCGRPDKEAMKDRDRNRETSLLDRLMVAVNSRVVDEYMESLEFDLSEELGKFAQAVKEAQEAGRHVHYVTGSDGKTPIPVMYKDADGKRVKRPKISEEQERGVDVAVKTFGGSITVEFSRGVHAFAEKCLAAMSDWSSYGASVAARLNAKFGVGIPPVED